jgi:hypothetical protein
VNVYAYESAQETALRGSLDVELGTLLPGPVPADAITARGRAIRRGKHRTWSLVASIVALVALGSSLLLPGVLRGTTPPATNVVDGAGISVNSAAYDQANGLLGSGTVAGKKAWTVSLSHPPLSGTNPDDDNRFTGTVAGSETAAMDSALPSAPKPNLLESLLWLTDHAIDDPPYEFGVGPVAQNVGSVLVHYADGASVSYPATEFEGRRYVAILDVTKTTIDKLTVYGTDGAELGYVLPFSLSGSAPETSASTWYTPNQIPAFAPAAITFTGTAFDAPGTPWTIDVRAGGFGVCEYTAPSIGHVGGVGCTQPGFQAANHPLGGLELGGGDPAVIVAGPLDPQVTRMVATLTDGETVQLPFKTIDGRGIVADVLAPGKKVSRLTAYEKNGSMLAYVAWSYGPGPGRS